MTTFADLGLSEELLRAVEDTGYATPAPIQDQAIPQVLRGRDVLGLAQTGTGKTAGFTLPMIDILASGRAKARMPRSLILEPTRELAAQVSESFVKYGKHHKLTQALIIGGVAFGDQDKKLDRGVDVLIATPGRLLDQFERSKLMLSQVQILVIDEADRMLDMGFVPDIERIVKLLPFTRQTLFFSATMPNEVKRIADAFLHNPIRIEVSRPATAAITIEQRLTVIDPLDKREALRRLIRADDVKNAIVFCNRKRDVDIVGKSLQKHGFNAAPIHGDLDQALRTKTLESFRSGELQILVASDVAARGLDVPSVSHVFNFDVPIHSDDYVHRIGRTGRAGRSGISITLATPHDVKFVDAIEKLTGKPIDRFVMEDLEQARRERTPEQLAGDKRDRDKRRRERTKRFDHSPEPRSIEDGVSMEAFKADPDMVAAMPVDSDAGMTTPGEMGAPVEKPQREERARGPRRERKPRGERAPQADAAPKEERAPREERAPKEASEARTEKPRREPREDRPARNERPVRDERSASSRDDARKERRDRYGKEDLGPSVVGFGDHLPAFLTVAVPRIWERPQRAEVALQAEPVDERPEDAEAA